MARRKLKSSLCASNKLRHTLTYTAAVKQSLRLCSRPSRSGAGGASPMDLQNSALNQGRAYWYIGSICRWHVQASDARSGPVW